MDDPVAAAALAPVVTALVAAIASAAPAIPRRLLPLVSIAVALALVILRDDTQGLPGAALVLEGILIGLAASGLYSGGVRPLTNLRSAPRDAA